MYICIYVYMYMYIYVYMYTCVYVYMYIYIYTHFSLYIHTYHIHRVIPAPWSWGATTGMTNLRRVAPPKRHPRTKHCLAPGHVCFAARPLLCRLLSQHASQRHYTTWRPIICSRGHGLLPQGGSWG